MALSIAIPLDTQRLASALVRTYTLGDQHSFDKLLAEAHCDEEVITALVEFSTTLVFTVAAASDAPVGRVIETTRKEVERHN